MEVSKVQDNTKKNSFKIDRVHFRSLLFWVIALLYLEVVYKLVVYSKLTVSSIFYTVIFTLPLAVLLFLVTSVFSKKINFIISIVITALMGLLYSVQMVYSAIFKVPLSVSFMKLVNQGIEYRSIAFSTALQKWFFILLFLIPLIFVCVLGRKLVKFEKGDKYIRISSALVMVVVYLFSILSLQFSDKKETSPHTLYYNVNLLKPTQYEFGVLTEMRLDAKRTIFGFNSTYKVSSFDPDQKVDVDNQTTKPTTPSSSGTETTQTTEPVKPIVYEDNVMEIDFDALIASAPNETIKDMHEYFKNIAPTKKNEYTGLFEGDNLVMITAESFSPYAVHEKYTPTLYKLAKESIQFNNFYNVSWGNSTTDGEYAACYGLIPHSNGRSPEMAAANYLPFCLGTQLSPALGYSTNRAYHNHTYEFYSRHLSHPSMGYLFRGIDDGHDGKGLDMPYTWPESDHDMMKAALPEFINDEQFHAYFMTVSGHREYGFDGNKANQMSMRHEEAVADLKGVLPEEAMAYIACNIELDKMLEELLKALEKAGKLDNTVIVLSADHYPYGLEKSSLDALAGHTVEETFEINKSTLIIWKNNLEPIVVDKPVASVDILPTVSNLFGLEYDSRLLSGRDALSDAEPLVIFAYHEWITDKCFYDPSEGVVKYSGSEAPSDDYVAGIRTSVNNRIKYAQQIIEQDYYAYAFGKK